MRRIQRVRKSAGCAAAAAVLLLLALLGACDRKPKEAPQQQAPTVSVVTVEPQKLALTTELSGRTSAFLVAEIRPRVSGLIQKRLFVEGSDVEAGQVLYQIDPAPFQAELNNALAALGRADANLPAIRLRAERYKRLLDDAALSQQDYDDAAGSLNQQRAYIKSLQASVDTARINLGYTKVTAPISGRIGKSSVTDGAIVTAYQATPLSTIQQLDPIYVDVPQSTTELLRMRSRMEAGLLNPHEADQNKVTLTLENGAPYPLEGILQFRDVTVDPSTGSVTLRAVFPNPKGLLLPGMFVKVVINEGVNEQAILVPQQGVSRDHKGNPYSLVADAENKVQFRALTLDRAVDDKWLVSEGLAAGDRVIVEGLQMLRPGTTVQTTPFQQAEPAQTPAPGSDAKS
ncbi:MAG TPA: efflux transporter periplasmic adaptor subunit [Desulfovibrio sp.]|nr:efflux transporter periplasmic adaptor subunit [Desulfovibrio sp.]HBR06479.1 efflux transporter periplasmic adaptor subunit [Desulfovibrio sp.]